MQIPPIQYAYVDRIEIKSTLNFQLDFSPVYKFVDGIATVWNGLATDLVQKLNKTLSDAAKVAEEAANKAQNEVNGAVPWREY